MMSEHAPLPPKIAGAIVAIMGAVPKLERTEKNTHGNYNFASIDDFLEAVRPLCAQHGLLIIQDEDSFEILEGSKWMTMRYSYTLAHASGETWPHRPTRTIMVNTAMGSQAFGAAQSYALKQFMRSLLQIATGEKDEDADTHKPESLPSSRKHAQLPDGQSSGTPTQRELAVRARDAIFDSPNLDALDKLWERLLKREDLRPRTLERLKEEYGKARANFVGPLPREVPGETYDPLDDTEAAIADLESMGPRAAKEG